MKEKELNLLNAKKIAFSILLRIKPKNRGKFLLLHSEKVGQISKMIGNKFKIYNDVFEIAGWIHDIGNLRNFENHADFVIPIIKERGYVLNKILEDCVLNHGNGKKPKTVEGKIFQVADKLSIFDMNIIKIMLKNDGFPFKNENINFLKTMSEKALKLIKNF